MVATTDPESPATSKTKRAVHSIERQLCDVRQTPGSLATSAGPSVYPLRERYGMAARRPPDELASHVMRPDGSALALASQSRSGSISGGHWGHGLAADRRLRVAAAAFAVFLFGPYLVAGVRTEQVVIYGLLLAALVPVARSGIPRGIGHVILVWASVTAVSMVVAIDPPPSSLAFGSLMAGLDNYLLPLASLIIAIWWGLLGRRRALDLISVAVCLMASATTLVMVLSLYVDTAPVLAAFWTPHRDSTSVAELAAQLGRLGGIFNQPAETGAFYSLCLLLALRRWMWTLNRPLRFAVVAAPLLLGGLLSVSKIFVLVGLPLFFVLLATSTSGRIRAATSILGAGLFFVGVVGSGTVQWGGQDRLRRLVVGGDEGDRATLDFLSAGRFGERSTIRTVSDVVASESPWIGFGISGLRVPYDSTWLEMYVIGGFLGLALGLLIFAILAGRTWRCRRRLPSADWRLGLGTLVVAVGSSFGLSILTANRVSSLLWVILGLTVLAQVRPLDDTDDAISTLHRPTTRLAPLDASQ